MPPRSVIFASPSRRPAGSKRAAARLSEPVAETARQSGGQKQRTAWWLWPHLLSLDAPLVAVVWQCWWAQVSGVRLSWCDALILGAGVWMVYLADRFADTSPRAVNNHETTRHAFYQRQRRTVWAAVVMIFVAMSWLVPRTLPPGQFLAGLVLLSCIAIYFWLIHREVRPDWPRIIPKEVVVGGMFAAGTGFFPILHGRPHPGALLVALPLFAILCFFNCALITKWERNPQDVREPTSLLNAFPRLVLYLDGGCLALALSTSTVMVFVRDGIVFAPLLMSALLLAGLDRCRRLVSADASRVLADAVLLTPWLCFPLLPHGH